MTSEHNPKAAQKQKDPEILKKELEEVAKIRFEHHQLKRMRKL